MIRNLLGAHELFPTEKYFSIYDNSDDNHLRPFSDQRDVDNNGVAGELSYQQIKDLLTNMSSNTDLLTQAESFHSLSDHFGENNGVEITSVVGSGLPTLTQI